MKNILTILTFNLLFSFSFLQGQTIQIHSIHTLRTQSHPTYTLNGSQMRAARAKLKNLDNFGPNGIYKKNVEITDAYVEAESLEAINSNDIDIFFFGPFINDYTSIPFGFDELDSLYAWSLKGGKMIIGSIHQDEVLQEKWGFNAQFDYNELESRFFFPTERGKQTKIFNGPFGKIDEVPQGNGYVGYFTKLPEVAIVYAIDGDGNPTMFLDCKTMDLVTHMNGFSEDGSITDSKEIISDNDRFWANTIAFMDSLDDSFKTPSIQYNDSTLLTGEYQKYQWLKGLDTISVSDKQSFTPTEDGHYRVVVESSMGCVDTSDAIAIGDSLPPVIKCSEKVAVRNRFRKDYAIVELEKPMVLDLPGTDFVFKKNYKDTFFMGTTHVTWTVSNSNGASTCIQDVHVYDGDHPRVVCESKVTLPADPGKNYSTLSLEEPVATDNIGITLIYNNAPDTLYIGKNWVKWTAEDSIGNLGHCRSAVTVKDITPPEISCSSDTTIEIPHSEDGLYLQLESPKVSDGNGISSINNDAPSVYPIGTTLVTWTAKDLSENTSTCVQKVTVVQTEIPDADTIDYSGDSYEQLEIPNIITPNGDGLNDVFNIPNLPSRSILIIYDRYNKLVYRSDNYDNSWGGTDMQGGLLGFGTYWYVLHVPRQKSYKGYVVVNK